MELERDLVGQILVGKLEVIRKLGDGGMGEVYEVEHRLTGHRRALKVVRPEFADRPRFMKRLLREARVAGTLGSDHVVETYDAGRLEDGSAYVLMELLHGQSLYDAMQADGTIESRRLGGIVAQVAEGMAAAHKAGIVHRDLKPENIYLLKEEDGFERVKILDFGVSQFESILDEAPSRLTAEGTLVGTPYYMSPEQSSGKPVDERSDVYAMGVMMYEALTGRLPYEAGSVSELFMKIGSGQCVPLLTRMPELDPRWGEIVHRAFDRKPDKRFPDAESLRAALLPLLEGGPVAARAKTLSSGVRSTVEYGEPLPKPPASPREADTLIGITSEPPPEPTEARTNDRDEARRDNKLPPTSPERPAAKARLRDEKASDAPSEPVESPPPIARSSRGWMWALVGAAAVLVVVVPLALSGAQDDAPTPADPTAPVAEPEATVEEAESESPARVSAPTEEPEGPAPVAEVTAPPLVEPPPPEDPPVARPPRRPRPVQRVDPASNAGLDPNPYR
ncbi:MAG: serine/threonine-protein kinase [Sandaracinaceae bacterium]